MKNILLLELFNSRQYFLKVLVAPYGDLLSCMEMAKVMDCLLSYCQRILEVSWLSQPIDFPFPPSNSTQVADLIAFVVSANSVYDACESSSLIDSFGTQVLSVFRAVGLPSTAIMIRVSTLYRLLFLVADPCLLVYDFNV